MRYLYLLPFLLSIFAGEGLFADRTTRHSQYHRISEYLNTLSDPELTTILEQGTFLKSGISGTTFKVEINGIPLFVKQIPLNELEGKPENILSTKNLYGLPTYYQYGVGSAGFSVWRELSAHLMSASWVLSGKNENFPLLYHWRIVEKSYRKIPMDESELAEVINYWGGSSAVGERLRANYHSSAYVTLFIEYIPQTLNSWLNQQWEVGGDILDAAIEMVERNLKETVDFINGEEMLHFDAHFRNILTDGRDLYFSDFGLATSSQFTLSDEEKLFFKAHQNYDRCYVKMKLVNWIVSHIFGKDNLDDILQQYSNGTPPVGIPERATPFLLSIVKRDAAIALKMNHFFHTLIHETKQLPYPADEME